MTAEILYGEDANRNGLLDANENDGDLSPPSDNRDGRLDPGLVDFVTVSSREPNTRADGSARINVANAQGRQQLAALLQESFGADRANAILQRLGPQQQGINSVLAFYLRSGMTAAELDAIESDLTATNGASIQGLVNVNTAPTAVLACLPGMDITKAETIVARRRSNAGIQPSIAWVTEVVDAETAAQIGPYITSRSYQVSADIVAVGHHGRGYRRAEVIIDLSETVPAIRAREDLTQLGRATDEATWQQMRLAAARADVGTGMGAGLSGGSLR
jgi:DNA uptake protein ComE-like DNA-binding protein